MRNKEKLSLSLLGGKKWLFSLEWNTIKGNLSLSLLNAKNDHVY